MVPICVFFEITEYKILDQGLDVFLQKQEVAVGPIYVLYAEE